jgi:hypothetical protein
MSNLAFERPTPNEQQVQMKKKSNNNPHSEWNIPADMPDVYYNYVSGTITIVDYANVTYNPISLIRIYGRTAFVLNRLPQWGRSHSNYGKPSVAARCQKKGCYAMKRLEKSIYLSA